MSVVLTVFDCVSAGSQHQVLIGQQVGGRVHPEGHHTRVSDHHLWRLVASTYSFDKFSERPNR